MDPILYILVFFGCALVMAVLMIAYLEGRFDPPKTYYCPHCRKLL